MSTLKLTLNKKWFDLIEQGIKTEEYREIKDYWVKRIVDKVVDTETTTKVYFKHFTKIEFTNGYNKNSPQITMECLGIDTGTGNTEWGAIPNETYFIIKLGREVGRKNCR
jgi:hypothetical protein